MDSIYLTSAQKANQLPTYDEPEIAFVGRSNCGKSTLINRLMGRKKLARVSSTPGRTQMANFFLWRRSSSCQRVVTDLPGYGFNVARKEIQALWDGLLRVYLERPNLSCVCCLFDCRRTIEPFEWEFVRQLGDRCRVVVVLTKADKVKKTELSRRLQAVQSQMSRLGLCDNTVCAVSSQKGVGIDELVDRVTGC